MKQKVMEALRHNFRPEFINRIDEIVIFHSLGEDEIKQIVDIQLDHFQELISARRITVIFDESVRTHLAKIGYDPVYGARPLKRIVQKQVADSLAMKILSGDFKEADTVRVFMDDKGTIEFKKTKHPHESRAGQ